MYLIADFARTKNAKDKKQRKRRILSVLPKLALGVTIPFMPMIGESIESNLTPNSRRVRKINKQITKRNKDTISRRVVKDIDLNTTKVYQDTFNELRNAGVSVDDSFMYAQTAANEYKNTMDIPSLEKLHSVNAKGLKKQLPLTKSKIGRNIGLGVGTALLGASVLSGLSNLSKARKRNIEKRRLRKLNKGKK